MGVGVGLAAARPTFLKILAENENQAYGNTINLLSMNLICRHNFENNRKLNYLKIE